jgi:uncharacterized membrane protein
MTPKQQVPVSGGPASDLEEPPAPPAPAEPVTADHRLFAFTLERIVFFSDAVIAIAMTLLAVELHMPELPEGQTDASFLDALSRDGSAIFAFVLSFTVIAGFWVGHYRTFRYLVDADGRLVAINFAFLFCIAILPYPTSIIATQGDLPSATIVYALFGLATGLVSTLLWVYPTRIAHLVSADVTPAIARYVTWRVAIVPIVFAASIPVAVVAPHLAWLLWLLVAPAQAVFTRRFRTGGSIGMGSVEGRGSDPIGPRPADDATDA